MVIHCCKGCVAPKRYPGCHDHCPEYLEEKAAYEAKKSVLDKEKAVTNAILYQRGKAVYRAMKGKKSHKCC